MESLYFDKMRMLGFDQLVCEIFPAWENVKDEILIPERKTGSGNGTIHVFLGTADAILRREFPTYYQAVENGEDPAEKAINITHYFLYSNVLSMLGHLCRYNYSKNLPIDVPVVAILTQLETCYDDNGLLSTKSLFKLSVGSSKPRPYFKQFDNNGVFSKIIRPILLPNSAYKVFLFKNRQNEYAAFWLLGFGNLTDFEADSTISSLNINDEGKCFFPLQTIFYGAPGTGKSHKVKEVTETLPKSDVFRTTFHPDSDYSTFVGCYKPKMVKAPIRDSSGHEITSACEDEKKRIAYEYEPQAFLKAYVRAYETNDPVFLVIEEINRGNCAQIFGDMFQLLDRNENGESDYAIKPETAIQEFLNEKLKDCDIEDEAIKSGEEMRLPANLHIWATMNTSDQSLFPMDSAFKRRWDWEYVPIRSKGKATETDTFQNFTITIGSKEHDNEKTYLWTDFLEKVNEKILDVTDSEDKQMGEYFIKKNVDQTTFINKVMYYLWSEVGKDNFNSTNNALFVLPDGLIKETKDGKEEDKKEFSFNDLFKGNAADLLQGFMKKLEVKSKEKKAESGSNDKEEASEE